jgi:hypothetical protein
MLTLSIESNATARINQATIMLKIFEDHVPADAVEIIFSSYDTQTFIWTFECSANIQEYLSVGTIIMVQRNKLKVISIMRASTMFFKMNSSEQFFSYQLSNQDFCSKLKEDYEGLDKLSINVKQTTHTVWAFDYLQSPGSIDPSEQIPVGSIIAFKRQKIVRIAAPPPPPPPPLHILPQEPVPKFPPSTKMDLLVFHDVGNCVMPDKKLARDENRKIIYKADGTPQFLQVSSNINGVDIVYDVLRYGRRHLYATEEEFKNMPNYDYPPTIYKSIDFYAVVNKPDPKNPHIWAPSQRTLSDYTFANVKNLPHEIKKGSDDLRLMILMNETLEKCISHGTCDNTWVIVISGDVDMAPYIQRFRNAGIGVTVIYSSDNPINPNIARIASAKYNVWTEIVERAMVPDIVKIGGGGGGGGIVGLPVSVPVPIPSPIEPLDDMASGYSINSSAMEITFVSHTLSYYMQGIGKELLIEKMKQENITTIFVRFTKFKDARNRFSVTVSLLDNAPNPLISTRHKAFQYLCAITSSIVEEDPFHVYSKVPNDIGRNAELSKFAKMNGVSVFCPGVTKEYHAKKKQDNNVIYLRMWGQPLSDNEIIQFCSKTLRVSINRKTIETLDDLGTGVDEAGDFSISTIVKLRFYIPYNDPNYESILSSYINKCEEYEHPDTRMEFTTNLDDFLVDPDSSINDSDCSSVEEGTDVKEVDKLPALWAKAMKQTIQQTNQTMQTINKPVSSSPHATVILIWSPTYTSREKMEKVKNVIMQQSNIVYGLQLVIKGFIDLIVINQEEMKKLISCPEVTYVYDLQIEQSDIKIAQICLQSSNLDKLNEVYDRLLAYVASVEKVTIPIPVSNEYVSSAKKLNKCIGLYREMDIYCKHILKMSGHEKFSTHNKCINFVIKHPPAPLACVIYYLPMTPGNKLAKYSSYVKDVFEKAVEVMNSMAINYNEEELHFDKVKRFNPRGSREAIPKINVVHWNDKTFILTICGHYEDVKEGLRWVQESAASAAITSINIEDMIPQTESEPWVSLPVCLLDVDILPSPTKNLSPGLDMFDDWTVNTVLPTNVRDERVDMCKFVDWSIEVGDL